MFDNLQKFIVDPTFIGFYKVIMLLIGCVLLFNSRKLYNRFKLIEFQVKAIIHANSAYYKNGYKDNYEKELNRLIAEDKIITGKK